WSDSITKAIKTAKIIVIIFSAKANHSGPVIRQVEQAVKENTPLLAFRIEDVQPTASMKKLLSTAHWIDALRTQMDQHLQELLSNVNFLLAQSSAPSDKPASVQRSNDKSQPAKPLPISPIVRLQQRVRLPAPLISAGLALSISIVGASLWYQQMQPADVGQEVVRRAAEVYVPEEKELAAQQRTQLERQQITENDESFSIYNTLGTSAQQPLQERQDTFECEQVVYTVIEMSDVSLGSHQLEVLWFDPSQTRRETTRYGFTVANPQERIWAWLKLHRASGSGMLKWIDSSAGLEEFIGDWRVEVKLNGRDVGQASFRVIC
ncbi:MAG: toll/interleukin-1 receptor domain-containing protein, partial [Proteobacteria bacterium]|nr:toll/interleukin-1 receptor domain-containing protein [Pseudomonadota bacterium]